MFVPLTPRLFAVTIPDWMRRAAQDKLPDYKSETDGVILLDEQSTVVKDNGEITTTYRRAYRILRPSGRRLGVVVVPFDGETKISSFRGWSISPSGKQYQVGQKQAVETGALSQSLYEDRRYKILTIPGADAGSVIGYEYEQRQRPYVLQQEWLFQSELPVRMSEFSLRLPAGWRFETYWANHALIQSHSLDGLTTWQVADVPAIETESRMPHWRSVAGRMVINYVPSNGSLQTKAHASWAEVGAWAWTLASPQRDTSSTIKDRVRVLTAGRKSTVEKIRVLSEFVQRDIRYVAIEIGIGGFRPHRATEVFDNRFGDCKDKATLLSSMLREIGVDSYLVLVNTERGYLKPEIPSALSFNHMILAIKLPPDVNAKEFQTVIDDPQFGPLLIFDPTSTVTPLGLLPPYEQENYALIVSQDSGELRRLPLLPPETNRLFRTAKLELTADGTLAGTVEEFRTGSFAAASRTQLAGRTAADRVKVLESFAGTFISNVRVTDASFSDMDTPLPSLVLSYSFVATGYAKNTGPLLVLKTRVLGQKSDDLLGAEAVRKYAVEYESASLERDEYELKLPIGYAVDELPSPLELDQEFASYRSKTQIIGDTLSCSRELVQKQVLIAPENIQKLRGFWTDISSEDRYSAVLKKISE